MGRIIELHGDRHLEIQKLLPWYVTGRLDAAEREEVEAHLGACADCQAELKFDRRLDAEIATLPLDVEQGWARMQRRLEAKARSRDGGVGAWLRRLGGEPGRPWRAGPSWLGWALAAQMVLLVLAAAVTLPWLQADRYHALGAAPAAVAGNVVVIFRPDTSEKDLRETLKASGARLVDGPTAADAYVLHVPAAGRAAALKSLRGKADIVLAEPIDFGRVALMRRLLQSLGLGLALWFAVLAPGLAAEPAARPPAPADSSQRVLVMLRMPPEHFRPNSDYSGSYGDGQGLGARRRIAERLAHEQGLSQVSDWPMPLLGVDCFVMKVPAGRSPVEVAERLSHDPAVAWAEPMNVYYAQGAVATHNDPLFRTQPAAREWRLADLHEIATGRNVRVAVIDSLIEKTHPDLIGQVEVSQDFVLDHPDTPEQHGTGVAGIIAALADNDLGIVGVAPRARLMALRACWQINAAQGVAPATVCDTLSLAKALEFAITHNAQVINMSLSGPPDMLLGKLLDAALARGITVVSAFDRDMPGGGFPASHAGIVAVEAESPGTPAAGIYSAPGRDVPTTQPGGRWFLVNGSSYAAAHVSGLFALLREKGPAGQAASALVAARAGGGAIDACATLLRRAGPCECACARAAK